jgi:hypothetical protein
VSGDFSMVICAAAGEVHSAKAAIRVEIA